MSVGNRRFIGSDGMVTDGVVMCDSDGNAVGSGAGAQNSSTKSVASTTTGAAGNILAANTGRRRYAVFNASTAVLYLLEGPGTASSTNYTTQVAPSTSYATSDWRGPVSGAWATANGNAMVTEYTA